MVFLVTPRSGYLGCDDLQFVVIGNGVAGFTAVQELAREKLQSSSIIQFTDEQYPYYWRPKLPEFLGDDRMTENDVFAKNLEWYRSNNVELQLEEKVEKIDPDTKTVVTGKGTYSYDRLLMATGADCFVPPVAGVDLCFAVRTLQDAITIRKQLKNSKSAAIIGGGVLGLEIANACLKRGLETTVIEYFPYLLPRQLDEEGGKILQRILESRNMRFYLGTVVTSVLGDKQVAGIRLKSGEEISTDAVISCTGIVSRKELAEKAGLKINRGIIVDDYMETSIKGIYAAGDAAEHGGRIYGLVMPSTEQARIAAANMVKPGSKKYRGSKVSATLKVTDLYLTSMGEIGEKNDRDFEVRKHVDEERGEYIKLFIKEDRIRGAIILGTKQGIALIRKMVEQETPYSSRETEIHGTFARLE
ncbi:MAG: NAD(P)/FAD-dependent oxidoreductase [Candidatus Odinarchaeota archaeon]